MHEYPQQLAPGLWGLGNYYFNLYLARGREASAVIEAGVSGVVDRVIAQLEGLGVVPDYLVVTHPHADHVTGLDGLRAAFPRAEVVAAAGASRFLAHPKAAASLLAEDRHMSEFLRAQGLPPERPPVDQVPSLSGCREAGEGEVIDLGGLTLRLFTVGGHSPGNLVVHLPEIGALALSDSLGFHYPGRGFQPLYFTGTAEFLATLDRLEALEPRIVCPGHQGPLTGVDASECFARVRREVHDLVDRIGAHEGAPEVMAEELFREYYRDELTAYSEGNIRGCMSLLVRRALAA